MSGIFAAFLGVSYETALLITTIVATIGTFGAMLAIVFFAWGPYVSRDWAKQFGSRSGTAEDEHATGTD